MRSRALHATITWAMCMQALGQQSKRKMPPRCSVCPSSFATHVRSMLVTSPLCHGPHMSHCHGFAGQKCHKRRQHGQAHRRIQQIWRHRRQSKHQWRTQGDAIDLQSCMQQCTCPYGDSLLQLLCHCLSSDCCWQDPVINRDGVEEALVLAGWVSRAGQPWSLDSWALSVLYDAHQRGQYSEGRSSVPCRALS